MFEKLKQDKLVYKGQWYRRGGFWIMAIHRFGDWADSLPYIPGIFMWGLYCCLKLLSGIFRPNILLWAGRRGAKVGPGLLLAHASNVMIGRGVEIGHNCAIYHDVTLGTGQIPGAPRIGDRVVIYPGARILGGVMIGDGSMIGANCVVTKDVPSNSTILAAPSRVIPNTLSPQIRQWDENKKPLQPLSNKSNTTLDEPIASVVNAPEESR
jgi:serine O-acetyltransferase